MKYFLKTAVTPIVLISDQSYISYLPLPLGNTACYNKVLVFNYWTGKYNNINNNKYNNKSFKNLQLLLLLQKINTPQHSN